MSNPDENQQEDRTLTGDAAFAAAVMAGVPVDARMESGRVVMTTAWPVSVKMDAKGLVKVFALPTYNPTP